MTCQDAFADIDAAAIGSMGSLNAISAELDSTITSCPTVAEWTAAAQTALPDIDMADAQAFLTARCIESQTLASTAICAEVGS